MTEQTLATTPVVTTSESTASAPEAATPVVEQKILADKFKSVEELEKGYKNLESMIGKKVNDLPEDVLKQFLKVPTSPDKYVLPDEAKTIITDEILKVAQTKNISQDQLKEIADALVMNSRKQKEIEKQTINEFISKNQKELETEFGINLEKRLDSVKSMLSQYGNPDLVNELKDNGILHNAKFVKFLDKITQEALSVKLVGADFKDRPLTPAEAATTLNTKLQEPEFRRALYNKLHPKHGEVLKEYTKLLDIQGSSSRG